MLRELLLDRKDIEKINLYQRLLTLQPDQYNIHELSQLFEASYSKTYSAIKEMDLLLMTIQPERPSMLTSNNKVIISEPLPPESIFSTYLIQRDIPFHFLIELIKEDSHNFDVFVAKHFISPSTARRKLLPLKKFLKEYRIHLNIATLKLSGDERNLRMVLASLLWLSTRGKRSPIDCLRLEELQKKIEDTLGYIPKNNNIISMTSFRKIDAEISSYRIKNGHFVGDDPLYSLFIRDEARFNARSWGAYLNIPLEHQKTETRYMAFRQFFGAVFFEKNDPMIAVLGERLLANEGKESKEIIRFRRFIKTEVVHTLLHSPTASERIDILFGNLTAIFLTYQAYQSKILFPFLLTESDEQPHSRIYTSLYQKINKFLTKMEHNPQSAWIQQCKEGMCKIFTAILLPDYEQASDEFHLKVAVMQEERYIYLHKLESFLDSLAYVSYVPFNEDEAASYDVIITSTKMDRRGLPKDKLLFFTFTMDEREFLKLEYRLKEQYILKNAM